MAEPRNADTLAHVQVLDAGADRIDSAYDLVARDNRHYRIRQFAIDDMQVGAADAAGGDPKPYLTLPGLPIG
jgi:hypothetical protein